MDYRQSGVDIDAGNETVRRIKSLARATFTPGVLFRHRVVWRSLPARSRPFQDPVLVRARTAWGPSSRSLPTSRTIRSAPTWSTTASTTSWCRRRAPVFPGLLCHGPPVAGGGRAGSSGVARGCRENGCALIGEKPLRCRSSMPRRVRSGRLHRRHRRADEDRRWADDRAG